jgi:hypothetical protein
MIKKIQEWAKSPEGKEALKTTAFVGGGSLTGVILNRLFGKDDWKYDTLAGIVGGLGGLGVKHMSTPEFTEQVKTIEQKHKDNQLKEELTELHKSEPEATPKNDSTPSDYGLLDAIRDFFRFKKSDLTDKEREIILKHSSANDIDLAEARYKAFSDKHRDQAIDALNYPLYGGAIGAGTGASTGGMVDIMRWLKRRKGDDPIGRLHALLGESAYGKGVSELGSNIIENIQRMPDAELTAASRYFRNEAKHPVRTLLTNKSTPSENNQVRAGFVAEKAARHAQRKNFKHEIANASPKRALSAYDKWKAYEKPFTKPVQTGQAIDLGKQIRGWLNPKLKAWTQIDPKYTSLFKRSFLNNIPSKYTLPLTGVGTMLGTILGGAQAADEFKNEMKQVRDYQDKLKNLKR